MSPSLQHQFPPGVVYSVVASFFYFSIFGCSAGSRSTQAMPPAPPTPNYKIISHSKEKVLRAIEKNLFNKGYIITSRNDDSGTMTAERYTTTPMMEEEENTTVPASGPTAGEVIVMILGIVLIVGLIAMLVDASSDNKTSKNKDEHSDNDRQTDQHHYDSDDNPVVVGYRYVMNIRTTAVSDTSAKVEVNMTKVVIENGTPTSSVPIKSSPTLKIFFESLENELYFIQ